MKKKLLSALFIVSLVPSFFSQYGRSKGVQEVSGIINLTNPIGFFSIILFFLGIWGNFKNSSIKQCFSYMGMIGMVLSELFNLLTWNYPNTSFLDGIKNCFDMVFPMFYIGIIVSIIFIPVYKFINKKIED